VQRNGKEPHRRRTLLWQRIVVRILKRIGVSLQTMSRDRALRWGEHLGTLAYTIARRQRRYARRNLRLVEFPSPTASPAERERLIRNVFIHFAKVLIDLFRGPVTSQDELDRIVTAEGWEHAEAAFARGKGVLFLSAHLGNWELVSRYVASHGIPVTVVAREPEAPEFAGLLRSLRYSQGVRILEKGNAAKGVLSVLRRGEGVAMLPDQNSGDVFVPFFGIPTGTVAGPATFSLHTGAAVVPCFGIRQPDDTYVAQFLPPLNVEATGDRAEDVLRIMTEVNRIIEETVMRYPDQWLWIHNRWKAAFDAHNLLRAWPEGEESAAYVAAAARWRDA
jgi:KDO2-lipid IV(A) lauroyltransferase